MSHLIAITDTTPLLHGRCTCGTTLTAGTEATFDQATRLHIEAARREACKQRHPAYADLTKAAQS